MAHSAETTRCKALGQFFTPEDVAGAMARWVCARDPETVADPAVGRCALLDACFSLRGPRGLIGFDIDDGIAEYVSSKTDYEPEFRHTDYLSEWGNRWDGLICNPPYMKFQRIRGRQELTAMFRERMGLDVSGYTNLLGYFILKGIYELRDGGRAAFLVPYEFLNNGYGTGIKEYMIEKRSLAAIIRFDNSSNVFDDAITTSCILLIEKGTCDSVVFDSMGADADLSGIGGSLPEECGTVRRYSELDPAEKWLRYFGNGTGTEIRCASVELSEIGQVMRGIATGDNGYFTLSRLEADALGISRECLMPCICRSPDIRTPVFTRKDFAELESENRKVYLFNGCNASSEADLGYISYGERTGVSGKYLTSHRSPWYSVERRDIAPILIGAFGRDDVKVVMNEAGVSTLAPFHGLHLNPDYRGEPEAVLVFSYLFSTPGKRVLMGSRREYGAKLDRYQPGDLNGSRILDLRTVSEADRETVHAAYLELRGSGDREKFLSVVDPIFEGYSEGTRRSRRNDRI